MFEEWTGSFSQLLPNGSDNAKGNQGNEWEVDPVLEHFDAIIDSDIKELYGRYKHRKGKNKKLGIVNCNGTSKDKENGDYIVADSFINGEHVSLENLSNDLLVEKLNDSRSTLDSSVKVLIFQIIISK